MNWDALIKALPIAKDLAKAGKLTAALGAAVTLIQIVEPLLADDNKANQILDLIAALKGTSK